MRALFVLLAALVAFLCIVEMNQVAAQRPTRPPAAERRGSKAKSAPKSVFRRFRYYTPTAPPPTPPPPAPPLIPRAPPSYYYPKPHPIPVQPYYRYVPTPTNPPQPNEPSCPGGGVRLTCPTTCPLCRAYPGAVCERDPCDGCSTWYYVENVDVCCDKCPNDGFPVANGPDPCTPYTCLNSPGTYCRPNYCSGSASPEPECIPYCDPNSKTKQPECFASPCSRVVCPGGYFCQPVGCTCTAQCLPVAPQPDPTPNPVPQYGGHYGG